MAENQLFRDSPKITDGLSPADSVADWLSRGKGRGGPKRIYLCAVTCLQHYASCDIGVVPAQGFQKSNRRSSLFVNAACEEKLMMKLSGTLAAITLMSCSVTALAVEADEVNGQAQPAIIERLFDCRKIEDPAARLSCFDREVAAVEVAAGTDDLVIADREQMKEAKRGFFGLSLPKIKLFGRGDSDEEEITKVEMTLLSASLASGGKWLLLMEDGAQWLQTDNTPVLGSPATGVAVTIERAALGSYIARIGKKRPIRVKRIN